MNRAAPSREGKGFGVVGRFSVNLHRRECRYPGSRSVPAFSPSAEHFSRCAFELMSAGGCASMYARASVMDPYRAGMRGVSWRSIPRARVSRDSTLPPPLTPRGSTSDFGLFFLAGCFPRLPRLSVVGVGPTRVVARGSVTRPTTSADVGGVSTTSRSEHMSSAASMSSSLTTRRR